MFRKFIIKNEESQVEEFKLKEFGLKITQEAKVFEQQELKNNKGFVINDSASIKSGLSYLKDKRISNKINAQVKILLEKEKEEIFEEFKSKGYEEGLQVGKEEGKKSVIENFRESIEQSLESIQLITNQLAEERKQLVQKNEEDLIHLIKLATEKFCLKEISLDVDFTKNLITKTLENHIKEEKINCKLSIGDYEKLKVFMEAIKKESLPQEISFEASDKISDGGLVVELESGIVDKNVETRFNKIWDALS